ncbi:MAG: tRNA lysidine(34) synthetase TilS [Elusimicrobia bacterium]|nr:tRNA lysidine(34) synthetase TilS [Elusimicrobiota bacterium]
MKRQLSKDILGSLDFKKPLVMCVSGGKDSVTMMHLAAEHISRFRVKPEVVHFNHGLRKESASEENFVRKLCAAKGLKINVIKLDVKGFAAGHGLSIEEAARELRYGGLERLLSRRKNKGYIFTGHTASDQLETVMFRLVKGTGRGGLRSVRKDRRLKNGWVVRRPLLGVTRSEIDAYAKSAGIRYRTDSSNMNTGIPRNYIRRSIIPGLKKLNPSIEKNMKIQTDIWSQEEDFLDAAVKGEYKNVKIKKISNKIYVELESILSYNKWLQYRLLRKISPTELDYGAVELLAGLIRSGGTGKRLDVGGGWKARKSYGKLVFEKEAPFSGEFCYRIIPGRETRIKELKKVLKATLTGNRPRKLRPGKTEVFDADMLDLGKIVARSRKAGDRLNPWGMKGTKKVKDFCIDEKLTLEERNSLLVVADSRRILWLAPYRRSGAAPVTGKTSRFLRIELKNER